MYTNNNNKKRKRQRDKKKGSLEWINQSKTHLKSRVNRQLCCICEYNAINACPNPCGHTHFCHPCLDLWVREVDKSCPLCGRDAKYALKLFM